MSVPTGLFNGFQQFTALPFLPFYIIVYAILEQDISDVSSLEFLQLQGLEFFVWVVSCSLQNNGLEGSSFAACWALLVRLALDLGLARVSRPLILSGQAANVQAFK
ncbi:hypothetical protein OIU77_020191 [Salix suchowensis]|uniref:Uncharacterized protein n=1 Tax=Salix suchowensis TaxID=1278906 RepID=A0ABQ9CIQ3_9ROSI|nr:hypothetical protein OIU77_020191 [Salix suchowensis]